jgi:hypothetical protein
MLPRTSLGRLGAVDPGVTGAVRLRRTSRVVAWATFLSTRSTSGCHIATAVVKEDQ